MDATERLADAFKTFESNKEIIGDRFNAWREKQPSFIQMLTRIANHYTGYGLEVKSKENYVSLAMGEYMELVFGTYTPPSVTFLLRPNGMVHSYYQLFTFGAQVPFSIPISIMEPNQLFDKEIIEAIAVFIEAIAKDRIADQPLQ
jgi:hypothetical protein